MAISVVGSTAPVMTTGAATVNWPAGHAVGDYALLIVASRDGQSVTTPSGWTPLYTPRTYTDAGAGSGNGTTQSVFYKFAASSAESSVTLNDPGAYTIASMVVYRGIDSTSPLIAGPTHSEPSSSTSATVSGITGHSATSTAPMFNVLIVSRGEQGSGGSWNSGNAVGNLGAGTTTVVQEGAYDGGAYEGALVIAHNDTVTSGVTYTPTVVFNGTGTRSCSIVTMITLLGIATSAISGSTSSALSTSAAIAGSGALATNTASTLSATGFLSAIAGISGTATLEIVGQGVLEGSASLAGTTTMTLTALGTGQAITDSLLSANVSLECSASGTLTAVGTMSATAGTVLTTSAALGGVANLVGASSSALSGTGTLYPISGMVGTSTSVLTVANATLAGSYTLGGNSFSFLTPSATLSATGRLVGSSLSLLSATGSMLPRALISGSSAAVLTTLATLRSVPNPVFAQNFRNVWLAVYFARQALLNKIMGVTKTSLDASATAITSLTSEINNPVTGLAAQAAAYTLLQSRVTATENTNVAQGISITGLSASLAGKADVSVTNALVARVTAIEGDFGYNLILNPGLVLDARNWGIGIWNSASRPQWSHGRNHLGSAYQITGTNNFGMSYAGTTTTAGEYYSVNGDTFPILPSTAYMLSVLLSTVQVAGVDFTVVTLDAAGTVVGEHPLYSEMTTFPGGTNRANWQSLLLSFTTPSTAVFALTRLRVRTRASGVNPRAHVTEPMLERLAPGQTVPTAFNLGPIAAWAEWNLTFNVNGYISGIQYANDGHTANFKVDAENFEVLASSTGRSLTWSNGHLWNKGLTYSVIIGQDMTADEDVIFWVGPNPVSPAAATKAEASIYFTEDGDAVFRGSVNQSLLSGSAMELGSTRIHTGGGRLAPFTIRDFAYKGNPASPATMTLTSTGYLNPDTGTGYDHKRFSRFKADVILECHMHGDGDGSTENIYLEVQYNGGSWAAIHSFTGINCDRRAGFSMIFRYTTLESWTDVAFRARTSNGRAMSLLFKVTIDNTQESSNTPGSYSGADASGGGGGAPPAPGGGGGGGDTEPPYCVDYDSMLPDGRYLRDVAIGDLIECVDMVTGERSMQPLLAISVGLEDCYRVMTIHGEVVQSKTTPMDFPDGSMVRTPDLAGLDLLTYDNGFETCRIVFVGERVVLKPDLGNRMFFAGVRSNSTIATHNIRAKFDP